MNKRKVRIEWAEYLNLIRLLGDKILDVGQYQGIVGVSRGGLIPSTILSHRFNLPLYPVSPQKGELYGGKGILVVDDLVDTGATLEGCEGDIAVLFKKPWSTVNPTYWVRETEDWVVFPYEYWMEK